MELFKNWNFDFDTSIFTKKMPTIKYRGEKKVFPYAKKFVTSRNAPSDMKNKKVWKTLIFCSNLNIKLKIITTFLAILRPQSG